MPITEKIAKEQLSRLRGMPGDPKEAEDLAAALKERRRALLNGARSEVHARRIVDSLLDTCQFFPTVSEIREACEYIAGDVLPDGCAECRGAPFVTVTRNGVEGAGRCSCERGRYLAARDRERKVA